MSYKPQFDTISEDTINCFYFSTEANDDISYWDNLCIDINKTIQNLSSEYLWHKDKLEVFPQILNEEQHGNSLITVFFYFYIRLSTTNTHQTDLLKKKIVTYKFKFSI